MVRRYCAGCCCLPPIVTRYAAQPAERVVTRGVCSRSHQEPPATAQPSSEIALQVRTLQLRKAIYLPRTPRRKSSSQSQRTPLHEKPLTESAAKEYTCVQRPGRTLHYRRPKRLASRRIEHTPLGNGGGWDHAGPRGLFAAAIGRQPRHPPPSHYPPPAQPLILVASYLSSPPAPLSRSCDLV